MSPPWKFQEIFPARLSRKTNGSKMLLRALSPPWKFLKVDRYVYVELSTRISKIYIALYGKINHELANPSYKCDADFTSSLVHGLAFAKPKISIVPYDKINHGIVNMGPVV